MLAKKVRNQPIEQLTATKMHWCTQTKTETYTQHEVGAEKGLATIQDPAGTQETAGAQGEHQSAFPKCPTKVPGGDWV